MSLEVQNPKIFFLRFREYFDRLPIFAAIFSLCGPKLE